MRLIENKDAFHRTMDSICDYVSSEVERQDKDVRTSFIYVTVYATFEAIGELLVHKEFVKGFQSIGFTMTH